MKRIFTLFIMVFSTFCAFAQNNSVIPNISKTMIRATQNKTTGKDTVIEKDTSKENKEPRYFYVTAATNVFVNARGGFAKRFSPVFEFGRTYGIFDIGLATGRLNSLYHGSDTSRYFEFRPTINVFSKGRFAEALCLGGGYVVNAKQGLMTEICNSINFSISTTVEVAVLQGYCFFDGTNNSRSSQYMGLSFTYNFLKQHSVNKQRKKEAIVRDK